MLDNAILKEVVAKKWLRPVQGGSLRDKCLTQRHAYHLIAAWRDVYIYHRLYSILDGITPHECRQ